MDVRIFFEYNRKIMQLPITPPEITIQRAGKNEKADIVKLGEVKIIRDVALAALTITSFFPVSAANPAVTTKGDFAAPDKYVQFFQQIRLDKKPCFLVITGLDVAMKVSIENFEYGYVGGDNDTQYTLSLSEYRDYTQRPILPTTDSNTAKTSTATSETPRNSTTVGLVVGAMVVVNGQLHRDSIGNGAGAVEVNATRRISLIDKDAAFPYHISTLEGGWRGWVSERSVTPV